MTNTLMYDLFNEIFKTGNWGVTGEPGSRSLVTIVLKDRSSWTLLWLDLLKKFRKVWSSPGTTKRSRLC